MFAAAAVSAAKETKGDDSAKGATLRRANDLPIYGTIYGADGSRQSAGECKPSVVSATIEDGVRVVREGVSEVYNAGSAQKQHVDDFLATGKAHSQFIFDYLNEPANGIHRAGAIAVGALSSYIIGIRRGFFRRLLYTSAGGLGVASICYPKEAAVYSQQALSEAKVYATILYNFAYGVKPGDEPKPLPLPSSLKEFYGSVSNLVFPSKKDDKWMCVSSVKREGLC